MLQCVTLTTGETCTRRTIVLTVQRSDCFPRRLLAGACRGTCNSYSRPSLEYPGQMESFCQCCDVDEVRLRSTNVTCPVQNPQPGQPPFRKIRVYMNLPRSCRCRPCSGQTGNVIPAEQSIWNQGKRNSNTFIKRRNASESDLGYLKSLREPFIFVEDNLLNFTYKEIG
jgi:hypothetical protein